MYEIRAHFVVTLWEFFFTSSLFSFFLFLFFCFCFLLFIFLPTPSYEVSLTICTRNYIPECKTLLLCYKTTQSHAESFLYEYCM